MTTACALQTVDELAAHILQKFKAGLMRLASRAGWHAGDLPGVTWLAAHDALHEYDGSKGSIDARAWTFCQRQARGFMPRGGADELDTVIGGDDPAALVEAADEFDRRLLGLGAGIERAAGSARSSRRHQARARSAAQQLLRGGDGKQQELF